MSDYFCKEYIALGFFPLVLPWCSSSNLVNLLPTHSSGFSTIHYFPVLTVALLEPRGLNVVALMAALLLCFAFVAISFANPQSSLSPHRVSINIAGCHWRIVLSSILQLHNNSNPHFYPELRSLRYNFHPSGMGVGILPRNYQPDNSNKAYYH